MNNILGTFVIVYLAFMVGGWHIIETYNGHFYECKPISKTGK